MSFGISIGDFIAVGKVIADISSNLRSSGGSKSEYQELERELETLQQILQQIDQLQSTHPNPTLDSVKYAALSCRHTLEQFLDKVQKYDHSLGVWSQPSKIRGAVDKLRWGIEEKDEVRKLQAYLNTHNAMINTLLLKLGLENMNAGFSSLKISGDRIQEITEDTHQSVVCIEQSVKKQEGLLDNFGLSLPKLIRALAQDFGSSWEKLAQMLSRLCESTEQIYTILVQIKTCTPAVNTRWTFFQDPVVVEDAFGVKFPVPSEYDGTLLHAIIRHRFSRGCEIQNVTDGGYSVFYTDDPSRSLSAIDHLFPGCRITVAAFVGYNVALGTPDCPICGSSNRAALPADGPHEW
ncbi:hypothetical protein BU26DRAFT_563901 [Trematosphaeria pertusa]|uniref:Fungal N-terminal domain-containing protein n=1 Tax=Trematosphaeria pertusa TaxID=390896 RepID=A0A6A6II28_9PLEO|nr:uncharacterized protein BU26DRAFT_563901 [Trematosphaeria pertusa]KAF2250016.1 hypothetical protein BU26DRAFT_563901 [Trematosphaeria pertusa]